MFKMKGNEKEFAVPLMTIVVFSTMCLVVDHVQRWLDVLVDQVGHREFEDENNRAFVLMVVFSYARCFNC